VVETPSDALPADPAAIARVWLGARPRLEPLGGGGFSGAPVMLVRPEHGPACVLKRVGRDAAAEPQARWVHALVARARRRGGGGVPAPLATPGGATLVADSGGGLWELVPLVSGASVTQADPWHLRAAMEVLARLHAAWSDEPGPTMTVRPAAPIPAMVRRVRQATTLVRHPWSARRRAAAETPPATDDGLVAAVVARWERALAIFAAGAGPRVVARIAGASVPAAPLQPVVRDIWFDHMLFAAAGPATPPRVTAIIDLHGAGIDTPATDIARLAGSWWSPALGPGCEAWLAEAVEAYALTRPLTAHERALVPWLHAAGVVCALDNWFRWVVEEGRVFPDAGRVLDRVDRLLDALSPALATLVSPGLDRV